MFRINSVRVNKIETSFKKNQNVDSENGRCTYIIYVYKCKCKYVCVCVCLRMGIKSRYCYSTTATQAPRPRRDRWPTPGELWCPPERRTTVGRCPIRRL